jgi:FKBP12-rapamycin complex-associated protein
MEEIIEIKQFENRVKRFEEENKGEYSYLKLNEELEEKKGRLRDIWSDRLAGAPKDVNVWYQILSTR